MRTHKVIAALAAVAAAHRGTTHGLAQLRKLLDRPME